MVKMSLKIHGGVWKGAKFLRKRKLQSKNTTFAWLKVFHLKRFNLLHLNNTNINMNLNTQI